jgi:DNA-binding MarR family transcriptional regulator
MLLTVQQRILLTLLKCGPLQNSYIAKRVGITEQHCSNIINQLSKEGLIESEFNPPRRINKLTLKGVKIAEHILEIRNLEGVATKKNA